MYADLHCDTFYKCFIKNVPFSSPLLDVNLEKSKQLRPYIQTFAHYIPETVSDKLGFLKSMLENTYRIIESETDIVLFTCKDDILKAERENKLLAVLSVEGGDIFTGDLKNDLDTAKYLERNNIRFLSMCYNHGSAFCGGAMSKASTGFTKSGLNIASMLCDHGIFIDVSHLNHLSTIQLLETDLNVIATHSNCFSLCQHQRNLTDKAVELLIKKDSLIGINLYSPFLSSTLASVDDIFDNIAFISSFGGEHNIAFGADFDGCDRFPEGINSILDVAKLNVSEAVLYNNVKTFLMKL